MSDWYDNIEPGVREVVRLLRNNGFNTTCSCHHDMTVNLDLQHLDDAERLATFLVENKIQNFRIDTQLWCPADSIWIRRCTVLLNGWQP